MYPQIVLGDVHIYVFGIFLVISWIVFFYCLHIFSQKKGIAKPIFSDLMSFTLASFLFSRLFFMFSTWSDSKFLFSDFGSGNISVFTFFRDMFITKDYNLSLSGGIIGFVIIFLWKTRKQKNIRLTYIDIIIPSFLIASLIGYLGAFFGGQIYGVISLLPIAVDYNTKYSVTAGKRFPLAILYILINIVLIFVWKKYDNKKLPDGCLGSLLLGGIGLMLFFGEFLSGMPDMFEIFIRINQLIGLFFIAISIIGIIKFFRS